ncbi:MAG: hypothetical protein HY693_04040 [Deltaproteobacteria bacterium]|nr:hypothetical protein [Deltaproteobacteria bacterium]
MKIMSIAFTLLLILSIGNLARGAENEETAKSWQQQASSTRAEVVKVADELNKIGDQDNPTAKGLIEDATMWLKMGDESLSKGAEAMEKKEWEKANVSYNMAWQYYVKAATAGLNAKRILTGQ